MCAEEFRPQIMRWRTISALTSGSKVLLAAEITSLLLEMKNLDKPQDVVEGKAWGRREKPQERAELRRERRGEEKQAR